MMINSVATYKESLSRIADGVVDGADELEIPRSNSGSVDRIPRRSPRFASPDGSPVSNGTGRSSQDDEISKYRADIQKLQASEAQIKALSFNYATILKEREEQLSKLLEENGSLRKSLDAKEAVAPVESDGSVDHQRPRIRLQRNTSQGNSWPASHSLKNSVPKQDRFSNGTSQAFDAIEQKMESESANSLVNGKEHKNLLEEIRSLESMRASHESEVKRLRDLLDNERENASTVKLKLQEERTLNESSQKELQDLKIEKNRTFGEMKMFQKELSEKMSELSRLQAELSRRDAEEEPNGSINNLDNLKKTISELEKENIKLQVEKNELEVNSKLAMKTPDHPHGDDRDPDRNSSKLDEVTGEMTLSMWKLEESLKDAYKERDKALQELARLKQHLLDKELEDSDKMDEDSKVIEELRVTSEHQKAYILRLEAALKQEVAKREDMENLKADELQKSRETIKELTQNLANCMSIVDSKNIELQNLQMALGQYYAESEAKERLGRDFAAAREQIAKLSESLKVSNQALEMSRREKEDITSKHSQIERMFSEGNCTVQKLEEDNSKLRHALERSMTTVNRMSLDSDNFVDRRIVIKLLVTYFQRNHSKEVLDLMVRMLGFTDEDKKRIGLAQSIAGKGVVRGVLGLPGRFVGGILGGSSPETASQSPDNQSFADLWVDFLLKESVEREKRESEEAAARMAASTPVTNRGTNSPTNYTARYSAQSSEHSDAEFATVPLTSSVSPLADKGYSSLPPRYQN